jgi:hypothetical protein
MKHKCPAEEKHKKDDISRDKLRPQQRLEYPFQKITYNIPGGLFRFYALSDIIPHSFRRFFRLYIFEWKIEPFFRLPGKSLTGRTRPQMLLESFTGRGIHLPIQIIRED